MDRRQFITSTTFASALITLHKGIQTGGDNQRRDQSDDIQNQDTIGRFKNITLYTNKYEEVYSFYTAKLGFRLLEKGHNFFSLEIGTSILRFQKSNQDDAIYHFAINIPTNKFIEGKNWLQKRTSLLKEPDGDKNDFYFESWDAHAIFFEDPAGNIGELISRHTLNNATEGDFALKDLLYLSEVGTPVEDPQAFGADLKYSFGLQKYKGSDMFVGDEYGLFVVPPIGRLWIPEKKHPSKIYPLKIDLSDKELIEFDAPIYPYEISGL